MASTITLTVDKKSVNKGDSVNVSWTSGLPDSLVLVIEDGDSVQHIQVPDSGSRLCWTNRATKDLVFTLIAATGTRKESVTAKVRVHGAGNKALNPNAAGIGKFQLWKEKMQARFYVARAQFRCTWASMKTWQKVLWIILIVLPLALLVFALIKSAGSNDVTVFDTVPITSV